MRLKISMGNSKIGEVPNISLPPGKTCGSKVLCYSEGCYAQNLFKMYPNVRRAWESNLEFYREDPLLYFEELKSWLAMYQPALFRLHVGGDFPDEGYWLSYSDVCRDFPDTQFLVFTKRYDYDYRGRSGNCQVVLSTWPGMTLPKNKDLPWAWIEKDCRIPRDAYYLRCPGNCGECSYRCWKFIDEITHVVFPKHR